MGNKKGRAKTRASAIPTRTPKTGGPAPVSTQDQKPVFSFTYADRSTTGDWAFKPSADDAVELFAFLCEMGKLTWKDIEAHRIDGLKKHHDQPVETLEKGPQDDYRKARLDRVFGDEEIFRFRLSGKKRLWGFRKGRIFHVVWWDWDHQCFKTKGD